MSAQHTPGPWSVEDPMGSGPDDSLWIVTEANEVYNWRCVALVPTDTDTQSVQPPIQVKQRDANARLIAAAPELLDAGDRLIAVFDQQRMTNAERIIAGISDAGLRTEGSASIDALRAAISKARGEA